jgi:hypothetical protein
MRLKLLTFDILPHNSLGGLTLNNMIFNRFMKTSIYLFLNNINVLENSILKQYNRRHNHHLNLDPYI